MAFTNFPTLSPTATPLWIWPLYPANFGEPEAVLPRPRCGHCGRFLKNEPGFVDFDRHLNSDCPVGGIFSGEGGSVLRGARVGNGRRLK